MNLARRTPATFAVVAIALIGCTQQPSERTAGEPQAASATATTPTNATADASPGPSATSIGEVAVVVPGEFTICIPFNSPLRIGTDEQVVVPHAEGDLTIERQRGYTWAGTQTATDLRFSGTHYYSWDGDTYTLASGDEGPLAYAEGLRIENADGAWQGEASGLTLPDGTSASGPMVLAGEGAYDALTAVLLGIDGPCFIDFRGIVMEFPDPPVPATSH